MSDVEAFELLVEVEERQSCLKNATRENKRKCILCLTLGIVAIVIIIIISLIPEELGQKKDSENTEEEEVKYPSYSDIKYKLLTSLADFPEIVDIIDIGKSVKGRNISTISIEDKGTKGTKQLVWVVCGMHAREWTSPLSCLHFITNILQAFKQQDNYLLKKFRFKIAPLANPDGYIHSQAGARLHRKNRQDSGCGNDFSYSSNGVDLNRNFPVGFTTVGSDVCGDTYPGTEPFSEPETRALRDAFTADIPEIFLGIHGSAQVLLTPYAYKFRHFQDDVKTLTAKGTNYRYGPASSVMYAVGGTMMDWVFEDLGVNRTFTLELRSLCDGETEEMSICHWQPDIELARKEILPEAWEIFNRILTSKL